MSTSLRRDIVNGIRVVIAVACLLATVSVAHFLVGLPGLVAVVTGAIAGYILARAISGRILPQVPSISDVELRERKIARRWLIWAVLMVLFFHFVAGLIWIVSGSVSVASGALGAAMDWRKRFSAQMRMSSDE